jgi:hypothetical protein
VEDLPAFFAMVWRSSAGESGHAPIQARTVKRVESIYRLGLLAATATASRVIAACDSLTAAAFRTVLRQNPSWTVTNEHSTRSTDFNVRFAPFGPEPDLCNSKSFAR